MHKLVPARVLGEMQLWHSVAKSHFLMTTLPHSKTPISSKKAAIPACSEPGLLRRGYSFLSISHINRKRIFDDLGKKVIDASADAFFKVFADIEKCTPFALEAREYAVTERHVHEAFFNQAHACGQGKRVAQLDQPVVIVVFRGLDKGGKLRLF